MPSRFSLMPCLALALVGWIAPAHAEPSADPPATQEQDFNTLLTRGLAAYEAARYQEALDAFESAWTIRKVPRLRYNAARCLERLGRRDEALEAYRAFLALPDTTAEERLKAKQQVEAIERERQVAVAITTPAPPAPDRTLSWVLFGGGLAGTAVGVTFGVLARTNHDDFTAAANVADKDRLAADGRRNAAIADVGLGVGLACVVAGVLTWVLEDAP